MSSDVMFVPRRMHRSPAFKKLTAKSILVLFEFLSRRQVVKLGRRNRWITKNNGEIVLTYAETTKKFGIARSTFRNSIDQLVNALTATPEAAIAGPRLIDGDGRLEISFGSMLSPFQELWQKSLVYGHRRAVPVIAAFVEKQARVEHFVDWVSGACLLVRRTDADAIGLLDERFFLYTEDVDFCAAARALGRRVLFTPTVEVVHLRGRSGRWSPANTAAAYRQSHLAFYLKHHPVWYPALRSYHWLRDFLFPDRQDQT